MIDVAYLLRRAAEENAAASRTADTATRHRHLELASKYRRAAQDEDLAARIVARATER